ncbi:hypothetical protein ANCDUO_20201, partial [Ancylostoma duodenale]
MACERDEHLEQAILARYVAIHRVPVKTRDFARGNLTTTALGYGFIFCLFVFFTDLPYFIEFWTRDYQEHNLKKACNSMLPESFRAPMLEGGPDKRAFDHGIRANYREVFGYNRKLWFLPIFS